uniref:C-type lectin domain-containing protein n=1 Tax=Naja naja TaxID=35670 RepID=A0A8C6X3I0_NAJNA
MYIIFYLRISTEGEQSLTRFLCTFLWRTLVPLNHQQNAIDCPPDWIGYQEHCYKFSGEKNWKESQNVCISHTASLAKITQEEKVSNVTVLASINQFLEIMLLH